MVPVSTFTVDGATGSPASLVTQCAAVSTHPGATTLPPQNCRSNGFLVPGVRSAARNGQLVAEA